MSFADIYTRIFETQKEDISDIIRDIIRKMRQSQKTFPDIEDEEEREMLATFSLICKLSFDVWVKKTIVENLIDEMTGDRKKDDPKDKTSD